MILCKVMKIDELNSRINRPVGLFDYSINISLKSALKKKKKTLCMTVWTDVVFSS